MHGDSGNQIDRNRAKKGLAFVLFLGIAAIAGIMYFTYDTDTLDALKRMNAAYLAAAMPAVFLSWFFSAAAFYILTKAIERPISMVASGKVYLGGSFFGFITPFGSGLMPTQVYLLSKEELSPGQAIAVTGARAMISSWLFAFLGLVILIAFRSSVPEGIGTNILIGVVAVAIIWSLLALYFIKRPADATHVVCRAFNTRFMRLWLKADRRESFENKIDDEINRLSANLKDLFSPKNYFALGLVFLVQVGAWFALFSVLPLVLLGFGWEGNFSTLIFRMFLLFCLVPVSPTPGGSGAVEVGFTMLLFGVVPAHLIGLVVLVWRALTYYLTLIAGSLVVAKSFSRVSATERADAG
ncbi:MAG: flippase-like domain-containing protein [Actinobacteria bacterium]|nr:flippase-like domain-containing protein [Actinomycetota bacterium]